MPIESASVYDETYKAGSDMRTKQYQVMKLSAADTVTVTSAATDRHFGILQNDPNSNEAAQVRHLGISLAVVDGSGTAIAVGDHLASDTNGRLVKCTTADRPIAAVALEAATTQGAIVSVFVLLPGTTFRTAA